MSGAHCIQGNVMKEITERVLTQSQFPSSVFISITLSSYTKKLFWERRLGGTRNDEEGKFRSLATVRVRAFKWIFFRLRQAFNPAIITSARSTLGASSASSVLNAILSFAPSPRNWQIEMILKSKGINDRQENSKLEGLTFSDFTLYQLNQRGLRAISSL